jgi:hypothetical protein
MKSLKTKLILSALIAGLLTLGGWAQTAEVTAAAPVAAVTPPDAANLRALFELARADFKTRKALLIAENLPLTADEASEFWPVYGDYEAALSKLNDQKLALIVRYAAAYEKMTDQEASALVKATLDLEAQKTELKRKSFAKFAEVVPATKAARFLQIDNQLNTLLDLQVAAALPLIK